MTRRQLLRHVRGAHEAFGGSLRTCEPPGDRGEAWLDRPVFGKASTPREARMLAERKLRQTSGRSLVIVDHPVAQAQLRASSIDTTAEVVS